MMTESVLRTNFARWVLVLTLALGLGACGGGQVRDESPLVRVNELSHLDDTISVQLSIRNVNDEALNIRYVEFGFDSDEQVLMSWQGAAEVNINAKGTETWTIEAAADTPGGELLDKLQKGEVNSLPYTLQGSVETVEGKTLRFESGGHIYPLPGKPGYFR